MCECSLRTVKFALFDFINTLCRMYDLQHSLRVVDREFFSNGESNFSFAVL